MTLESPLDCKEIQPVHSKGNQSWVFNGRPDVQAETPVLWPPDGKSWLIWKDPDAGKDWRQEEKGMTEDEMAGWRHWFNGHGLCRLWQLVVDREAWCAVVHGVTKSWTWLSNCTELKMGMKITPMFKVLVRIRWINICKVLIQDQCILRSMQILGHCTFMKPSALLFLIFPPAIRLKMEKWNLMYVLICLQISLLFINSSLMDRDAWHAVVHGIAKSQTQLSDWTELNNNFNQQVC